VLVNECMLTLCPIRENIVGLLGEHLGHHVVRYESLSCLAVKQSLPMADDAQSNYDKFRSPHQIIVEAKTHRSSGE